MPATAISRPFLNASPVEIREVLLPEERGQFEAEYEEALRDAAELYSLDKLHRTMECWRRIAWMTHADPEAHRLMLARAEYTLATRERAPEGASADELGELRREHADW